MAKKPKLSPIEREINTRRRRIDKANQRIKQIESEAKTEIESLKYQLSCDQAVLDALVKRVR
jgi:hypothetical protein